MATERDLVRLAIRRDADAFGQLYQIHLDSIYRYVFYRVGSAPEAEDLTEQVFLKAWEHIAQYDERGLPFAAWLYRMAHNLVVDLYRTRRVTEELAETVVEDRPGPAETVERRMEAAGVAAALRTLPQEYQQVIVLRFVQGLSHAEAAGIMERSEGAVRILQHRALGALQRALTDGEPAVSLPVTRELAASRR